MIQQALINAGCAYPDDEADALESQSQVAASLASSLLPEGPASSPSAQARTTPRGQENPTILFITRHRSARWNFGAGGKEQITHRQRLGERAWGPGGLGEQGAEAHTPLGKAEAEAAGAGAAVGSQGLPLRPSGVWGPSRAELGRVWRRVSQTLPRNLVGKCALGLAEDPGGEPGDGWALGTEAGGDPGQSSLAVSQFLHPRKTRMPRGLRGLSGGVGGGPAWDTARQPPLPRAFTTPAAEWPAGWGRDWKWRRPESRAGWGVRRVGPRWKRLRCYERP